MEALSNFPDGESDTVNFRQVEVPGDPEQHPFFEDFFEFLPTFLQGARVGVHAGEPGNLAVVCAVIGENLVSGAVHGALAVARDHLVVAGEWARKLGMTSYSLGAARIRINCGHAEAGRREECAVLEGGAGTMPDKRKHRGPHPADEKLFGPEMLPALREAVSDLSWLLTRGYSDTAALKLVGDRYTLRERQRTAVLRSSCSDQSLERRRETEATTGGVMGAGLHIDGFNLLTTLEAALSGGVILAGRDGCCRDLASMHGNYRKVEETEAAVRLAGEAIVGLSAGPTVWYLDRPVSNSGRLSQLIRQMAAENSWQWETRLVDDPDPILAASGAVVCSADSVILDKCARWLNLATFVVDQRIPTAWVVRIG